MGYFAEEQEIVITKLRTENVYHVYTSDSTWLTKLLKFAEPIDPEYENDRIIAAKFILDTNQVTLKKKPKKREMTAEQRLAQAERMRELHNKNKLNR